ncbi:hypothetical protein CU044_2001 [Streptomyces sp. L-9-10]|nr:hypothetical protein CU044_2001 [Streptomyces sp. L-9-10]
MTSRLAASAHRPAPVGAQDRCRGESGEFRPVPSPAHTPRPCPRRATGLATTAGHTCFITLARSAIRPTVRGRGWVPAWTDLPLGDERRSSPRHPSARRPGLLRSDPPRRDSPPSGWHQSNPLSSEPPCPDSRRTDSPRSGCSRAEQLR